MNESMDMSDASPLPRKMPFTTEIEIMSPTPVQTPQSATETGEDADEDDAMLLDSPLPISRQTSVEQLRPSLAEYVLIAPPSRHAHAFLTASSSSRRKPSLRRPSLSRAKGYSMGIVPCRAADNQLPAFRFGGDSRLREINSAMSLGECFEAGSPPQERRPQTANSPVPAMPAALRVRAQFSTLGGASAARNGSPMSAHTRRPSNPFRPRKQFRRSLSMFEHPGDVMKPKPDTEEACKTLQSVMDIPEVHEPLLPHFSTADPTDTIPRITKQTMVEVLDGKYNEHFVQTMVIDCRFEYEYSGGHIEGAVNFNDKELLTDQLFETPLPGRTLLVFHCEYSAHRAPLMARHIRSQDRTANVEHYPRLTYPEVYILDGGYSAFFSEHRGRCYPQSYVEMSDEKHQRTCERELGRLKNNGRKGLGRAQTFHFGGAREHCIDDSPTAPGRPNSRQSPIAMFGNSSILGERSHARRMASY